MPPEEFRRWARIAADWIADYHSKVGSLPVMSQIKPGELRASLPPKAPEHGETFKAVLEDLDKLIMPGLTHWQSPNFFGYFPCNNSFPSILGEILSAGLGVQGMLWATSPACTELEAHVLDWMAEMMGLPAKFKSSGKGGGVIQDSASSAVLCALLSARERATNLASNERGCDRSLTVYASNQAHSSVEKAVKIAGIGKQNLRLIETDERFAMRPEALATQITKDRKAGLTPCFVCATTGTTSSNGFDPLSEIGRICRGRREESARRKRVRKRTPHLGIWLHVDAAMSGTATICPEFRHFQKGLEFADSYASNPHKWMFTNFDCDCFYVADRASLIRALSVLPEYLRNQATESGSVIDYRDWQIPLGRRFRALKLWFVIRHYGVEGLKHHIRRHVALAQEFADWVGLSDEFELLAPVPLNLVCFAAKAPRAGRRARNEFNAQLLDRLNKSGKLFLTHTILNGCYALRFCIGQTYTEREHVDEAWRVIRNVARELGEEKGAQARRFGGRKISQEN